MPDLDINALVEQARALTTNIVAQIKVAQQLFKDLGFEDSAIKAEMAVVTSEVKRFEVTF